MILDQKPISLAEVKEYVKNTDENKQMTDYLRKFGKLSKDKADSLIKEIKAINNPKINEIGVIKIADILPQDAEELNRLFSEVNLTEEEANAILNVVKNY